jgi:hypothetical protein
MATTTIPEVAQCIIDSTLTTVLGDIQRLHVTQEVGIPVDSRGKIQFCYCPMIEFRNLRPRFFYNGSQEALIENTDYEFEVDDTDPLNPVNVGLETSQITLLAVAKFPSSKLTIGDEIRGDYTFQYFSEAELFDYLNLGLYELNARKPNTGKDWPAVPLEWNAALTLYAASQCFQQILNDTTLWKSRIIFADPQAMRDQIKGNLDQLNQRLDFLMKVTKRRGEARPLTVVTSKMAVQQRVTQVNWQSFAIIQ